MYQSFGYLVYPLKSITTGASLESGLGCVIGALAEPLDLVHCDARVAEKVHDAVQFDDAAHNGPDVALLDHREPQGHND